MDECRLGAVRSALPRARLQVSSLDQEREVREMLTALAVVAGGVANCDSSTTHGRSHIGPEEQARRHGMTIAAPAWERLVRRRPVLVFFVLAYAFSWSWYVPLAVSGETVKAGVGWPTHLPGLLGPALAAVAVTAIVDGRTGLRDLAARMVRWRIGWGRWAVVAGTASLAMLGVATPLVTGHPVPPVASFTTYTGIGTITPLAVVAVALLVNGLGEETGWRGFAVERLVREHPLRWTAVVVAIGWAGWHLPFFFFVESFRGMGPLAVGWAVGILAGSVVLTWLYLHGHHSVLLVAAWHT